jgi:hypothetical protein
MIQHKNQIPTQTIKNWISKFVTKPNKVEFLELDSIASYNTLYQHIWNFAFEEKDVLCMIAKPDQFTAKETVKLAKDLNAYFMSKDVYVKSVKLNNGHYILFLVQSLSRLNKFSKSRIT